MKLNNTAIASILKNQKAGRYSDGRGLYFVKTPTGTGNWVMLYRHNNKVREMGLGSFSGTSVAKVSLEQARRTADKLRGQIAEGIDPLAAKKRNAPSASFRSMMEAKIAAKLVEWGPLSKMPADWRSTLTNHAKGLMDLSVAKVDKIKVQEVLKREVTKKGVTGPLWTAQSETATRVLERIVAILDYAKAKGLRDDSLDASDLRNLLGAQKGADDEDENHTPMAREMIRPFWAKLTAINSDLRASVLKMIVLTGARLSEVREMKWAELEGLDDGLWLCPEERMKARKAHTFTLSAQAIALFKALPRFEGSNYVFANPETGAPFAPVTIRRLFRGELGVTPEQADIHGFRSCFESWVHDETSFGMALAHQATAHAHKDETGKHNSVLNIYQKGQALAKRTAMLQAWADYLDGKSNVVKLAA